MDKETAKQEYKVAWENRDWRKIAEIRRAVGMKTYIEISREIYNEKRSKAK